MPRIRAAIAPLLLLAGGCDGFEARPRPGAEPAVREATEWPAYGGDHRGLRFSALDGIRRENVAELEVAWTYRHRDVATAGSPTGATSFEATPILVDGILYFPTPFSRVIALDPASGAEHWTFDPEIDRSEEYHHLAARGVAAWEDGEREEGLCARRIFFATIDAYLLALDAATGRPCPGFGEGGRVDLNPAVGPLQARGEYGVTSPPEVVGDRVIVGSMVSDNLRTNAPSGVVRAFDARSGALRWAFDLAPPGYDRDGRPTSDAGYALGTPNVWAPMSSDPERDLLFVPTGNPAPDYYRGERSDLDHYGSSVLALRASTGEVVWRFQTVHHDRWDYDVPAQPTLVELEHEGERVPALVQGTKLGVLFVLDRETGEPVFGVEERPVPQQGAPGESLSPTQPIPVKPPPLLPLRIEEVWGLTPLDRGACREALEGMRYAGPYTPPGTDWSVTYPAPTGGINWGGVAVDPRRDRLYVNTSELAMRVRLVPRAEFEAKGAEGFDPPASPQAGTPYAMQRDVFTSPLGLPCNPPPWGRLTAVDLEAGEILWQEPFGRVSDATPIPLDWRIGLPSLGGPLVTGGGLLFLGGGAGEHLYAFDARSGEELWRGALPAGGYATPMTYRVEDAEGGARQYVVIAAGGHGVSHEQTGDKLSDVLVAFALPAEK